MTSIKVSVVSYNVLSPNLVSSHKIKRDPACLTYEYRLNLLFDELEKMIDEASPIIALQEVSNRWSEELVRFFSNRGYGFYWAKGTTVFNGYMGVALAWPLEYTLSKLEVVMPGSFIAPDPPSPLPVVTFSQKWLTWFKSVLHLPQPPVAVPQLSERTQASKKTNESIIATFVDGDNTFTVATYHMPCAFTQPELMRLHAEALIALVKTKAGNNPLILLGDFNATPDSEVYQMLTSEFTSAYNPEPEFTNKAMYKYDTMASPVEFTGTIDYIFSRGLRLLSNLHVLGHDIEGVPRKTEDFNGVYLPTFGHLSDHLPIGATYEFLLWGD